MPAGDLLAQFGEQQVLALRARARAHRAAVPARAAVLGQDAARPRAHVRRRSRSPSASPRSPSQGAGDGPIPERRARAGAPDAQGDARRAGLRVRARARCSPRCPRPARCSTRSIGFSLRRARRPASRAPVVAALASSTRWSASLVFIAIGGDAWVIQGSPAPTRRCRCSRRRSSARSSRARSSRSAASSPPRVQVCAPVLLALSSPTPRSASSRASCRSSTSSPSASRPRSPSACCSSARRCRSPPAGSPTSSSAPSPPPSRPCRWR